MNVVVTGGSGLAGRYVVYDLVQHGEDVLSVDRVAPQEEVTSYRRADLEELGQVYSCLAGADAVVHLAAIPRPQYDPPEVVFRTNTMITYNVFEVALNLGIPRVIYVSSVSVLGFPFNYTPLSPHYVPIDEQHPKVPQDPYALSKKFGEDLGDAFVQRSAGFLSVVSLRFPWIHTPETFNEQIAPLDDNSDDAVANLWSYIDARDVAQACRLALGADVAGHEKFFLSAPNTFAETSTETLVRRHYPETEIRAELDGTQTLITTEKAQQALDFAAEYTWHSY